MPRKGGFRCDACFCPFFHEISMFWGSPDNEDFRLDHLLYAPEGFFFFFETWTISID